ncbi:hypothetical protein U2F10_02870 [Leptothoe sp. EHU-05/26/07-4]
MQNVIPLTPTKRVSPAPSASTPGHRPKTSLIHPDDTDYFHKLAIAHIENNLSPVDIRLSWQKEADYYYSRIPTTKGSDLCILINPMSARDGRMEIFCRFESVDLVRWPHGPYNRVSGKYNFHSEANDPEQALEEFKEHLSPLVD